MRGKLLVSLLAGAALLPVSQASAHERKLVVDDDRAQCPQAQYTTIQTAVNAAGPGDTVLVCPGTYTEQVRIQTHQKDKLKLLSLKPQQAIIQSPAVQTFPKAIVLIEGADRVTLAGFVFRGPFVEPACGEPIPGNPAIIDVHKGVYVKNGFKELITHNRITQIRNSNPALLGCQDGIAVQIGRNGEAATGSAEVEENMIDDYQKGGVVVDNTGSFGEITRNVIRASVEAQSHLAPNGVQVSRGAGADVERNKVSRNKFLVDPVGSGSGSGILLFQPGADRVEVTKNESFDNDDGLPLIDADRELIKQNFSHDNVIFDGLFADVDSERNLFFRNVALRNTEHDCHDDSVGTGTAGTANTWKDDTGVTDTPEGICRPPHHGDGDDHGDHGDRRQSSTHKVSPTDVRSKGSVPSSGSVPSMGAPVPQVLPVSLP